MVTRLNATIRRYPVHSFATHLGSSLATFGAAFAALSAIGFDAPSLAVAGVVSRLTKKFRTPVDMSLAAALAHAVPATNALKLGPLLSPMHTRPAAPVPARPEDRLADELEGRVVAFTKWVEGPVNQYGAPYMFVHWCTGLATVSATTAAVHHGVDVVALVSSLPFVGGDEAAQLVSSKASCVAGAMVLNTLSLPARLALLSRFGDSAFAAVDGWRAAQLRQYRAWLRRRLREDRSAVRRLELRDSPADAREL